MKQQMIDALNGQVLEVELVYRTNVKAADRPKITSSKDSFELLRSNWNEGQLDLQEQFKVVLLTRANQVLGVLHLSSGSITATVVDPKLLFAAALKAAACAIIVAHNHPSGCLEPSVADIAMTERLNTAAQFLDIHLLDHLIVSREHYFSFSDEGLL